MHFFCVSGRPDTHRHLDVDKDTEEEERKECRQDASDDDEGEEEQEQEDHVAQDNEKQNDRWCIAVVLLLIFLERQMLRGLLILVLFHRRKGLSLFLARAVATVCASIRTCGSPGIWETLLVTYVVRNHDSNIDTNIDQISINIDISISFFVDFSETVGRSKSKLCWFQDDAYVQRNDRLFWLLVGRLPLRGRKTRVFPFSPLCTTFCLDLS